MRILLMADSFGTTGGGEVMVDYLARELRKRHTVAVLTAGTGGTQPSRSGTASTSITSAPTTIPAFDRRSRSSIPSTVRDVERALDAFQPDVVHAWNVHHHLGYESLRIAANTPRRAYVSGCTGILLHEISLLDRSTDVAGAPRAPRPPRAMSELPGTVLVIPSAEQTRARVPRARREHPVSVSQALADGLVANGLPRLALSTMGLPPVRFLV